MFAAVFHMVVCQSCIKATDLPLWKLPEYSHWNMYCVSVLKRFWDWGEKKKVFPAAPHLPQQYHSMSLQRKNIWWHHTGTDKKKKKSNNFIHQNWSSDFLYGLLVQISKDANTTNTNWSRNSTQGLQLAEVKQTKRQSISFYSGASFLVLPVCTTTVVYKPSSPNVIEV